ncbi:hypothetical protein C8035_v010170 [Colletotrichum spinosum]|uniref:Uncharacterized protein n=1 Tax=Colletotrichum spinosum TaxID=1347390 RepID=A0A4R8QLI4_9PEZI|nr:hypothetical protein C8035_v010170 [Colletotrichum spinosum]
MALSEQCFVDHLIEPVKLVEFSDCPSAKGDSGPTAYRLMDYERLDLFTKCNRNENYTYRLISICQRNSWRPLQITKSMLELLIDDFELDQSLWDLASCFYTRNMDVEEVFCMPYTEKRSGTVVEASYSIRYPEFKTEGDKWVLRQTGVYQRINLKTRQSFFILFNPMPNSKVSQAAEDWLLKKSQDVEYDPLWLHRIVLESYLPSWRSYIASLEKQFLPMAHETFSNFIEEPATLKPSHLTTLASMENRFLQIPAILASAEDVLHELSELHSLLRTHDSHTMLPSSAVDFANLRRRCGASSRAAMYLHKRAQTTAQLLANTLSFREQLDTRKQNESMLSLNKSVVFITTLTLLYLPPSFVATFFGMNFFDLDNENNRIISTPMIWIYIVCSILLTAATFFIYHMLLDGGPLGKRKLNLSSLKDWREMRLWVRRRSTFAEKQPLSVSDAC